MSANAVNLNTQTLSEVAVNTQTGSEVAVNTQTGTEVAVNTQTESELDRRRRKKRRNSFLHKRQKARKDAAHASMIKSKMRQKFYKDRGALG